MPRKGLYPKLLLKCFNYASYLYSHLKLFFVLFVKADIKKCFENLTIYGNDNQPNKLNTLIFNMVKDTFINTNTNQYTKAERPDLSRLFRTLSVLCPFLIFLYAYFQPFIAAQFLDIIVFVNNLSALNREEIN